jgi:hypothetical protein
MAAFYSALLPKFLATSPSEITGVLSHAYARDGFANQRTTQTISWLADIQSLQACLAPIGDAFPASRSWNIVLEFAIPRKEKRIDVVLLAGDQIIILELKSSDQGVSARRQAEEYALLLHYFHKPSYRRQILTFVVGPSAGRKNHDQLFLPIEEAAAYWVASGEQLSWLDLYTKLQYLVAQPVQNAILANDWLSGAYHPVPSIIEAARSLHQGLNVREVAHSRAARHDVERLTKFVHSVVEKSKAESQHSVCFITGVPGSGKTLVGLNMALATLDKSEPIHFMSGTGPLVQVLQTVLARHHQQHAGVKAADARLYSKTLIENVHVFAKHYAEVDTSRAPSNHVIVFDEAQRAWNKEQNLRKFKRNYSEPEMLLSIMGRHEDWAVVIALVGGGQEINSGEAGLEEWGRALSESTKPWNIYVSPAALNGGDAVAGSRLFSNPSDHPRIFPEAELHLDVSVRSLNAKFHSAWVNHVVEGNAEAARMLRHDHPFPVLLTRSLSQARALLGKYSRGENRIGLVGSSGAARLRADGLEPDSNFHGEYPWSHWYLAPPSDVRSSNQLEVFATEFEIQGLELDWVGLCWGGDFIWSAKRRCWVPRAFRPGSVSKWSETMKDDKKLYRRNAYRVLLTRARQGLVVYIPNGDPSDSTRLPSDFEATAEFLVACGASAVSPSLDSRRNEVQAFLSGTRE